MIWLCLNYLSNLILLHLKRKCFLPTIALLIQAKFYVFASQLRQNLFWRKLFHVRNRIYNLRSFTKNYYKIYFNSNVFFDYVLFSFVRKCSKILVQTSSSDPSQICTDIAYFFIKLEDLRNSLHEAMLFNQNGNIWFSPNYWTIFNFFNKFNFAYFT